MNTMITYELFQASCPHCGAPVLDKKCPYCQSMLGTFLADDTSTLVNNKKGIILSRGKIDASIICSNPTLKYINRYADDILSEYGKHSNAVYDFMDKNKIGHSVYGKMMDGAAKGKEVVAHRLYGHHPVYNFPIKNPKEIQPFMEHLLSDSFTKMGLPIIPGEILEDTGLLKYCDKLTNNWNFVNGFDILSGTVALVGGIKSFSKCFSSEGDERTVRELASQIGIGTFELLVTASTYNPLLLVGSLLTLTSGMVGLINKGARAYLRTNKGQISVTFSENAFITV